MINISVEKNPSPNRIYFTITRQPNFIQLVIQREKLTLIKTFFLKTTLFLLVIFLHEIFSPSNLISKTLTSFNGSFVQGGLIIGKTKPHSQVTYNEKTTVASANGIFLIGFGRDAPSSVRVSIAHPSGIIEVHNFLIKRRNYKKSHINGLPKNKVIPNQSELIRIKSDNQKIKLTRLLNRVHESFLSGFLWPIKGRISGDFGSQRILNGQARRPHNGIDIAAPVGTKIISPANGFVTLVDQNMFLSGKTVIIDHGHGLASIFIHMNSISVNLEEKITKGQEIGTVGMTGRATGPHLHWGITLLKTHLDPALLVK